mgnify:CR=1 FL=1
MLSDDTLDRLMQPIIDREESINTYILEMICKKIGIIGRFQASDINLLLRMYQTGADVRKINKEIARLTALNVVDVKKLIKTAAIDAHMDAKVLYDYRKKPFIPYEKNKELQQLVESIGNITADSFKNISNTSAFMIRDKHNPNNLIATSLSDTYQQAIDKAIQAIQFNGEDYTKVIRRTVRELAQSGLRRVSYDTESGKLYTRRLDTSVRMNIMDGVRAIRQGIEDMVAEQIGADAKEISVHMNSAPDHEPIQGHIFRNEEYAKLQSEQDFQDIKGEQFSAIARRIGVWNCRHFAYAFIIGVSRPRYSQRQLEEYKNKNQKGYTFPNGKHLTMYECTQYQRKLETRIRYAKEEQIAFMSALDDEEAKKCQDKVEKLINTYNTFSESCGLKKHPSRYYVDDYKRIKEGK